MIKNANYISKNFKGASEETLFWMMTWFLAVDYNNTKLSIT